MYFEVSDIEMSFRSMKSIYFRDLRKKNEEKKKRSTKIWIIIAIILILAILAVGIYLIIHFTTQTTSNTTKSICPFVFLCVDE